MKKTKLIFGAVLLVAAAVLFAQESTENAAEAAVAATETTEVAAVVEDLKEAAAGDASLSAYVTAIENSPVDPAMIQDGVTILAVDSAENTSDSALSENIGDYIVVGKVTGDDLLTKSSLKTLSGKEIPVQVVNDKFVVNGTEIVSADAVTTDTVVVHKLAGSFEAAL